jgi:tRNA(fMet)-specific endonuclease VapC
MKYLLDTNVCIYIIKKHPEKVIKHFSKIKVGDIAISSITISELYYGASKSSKPDENIVALQGFLLPLRKIDFSIDEALVYGKIRTDLERKGKLIGAMDLLIASTAVNRNLILITNNSKEFSGVSDLRIENWAS